MIKIILPICLLLFSTAVLASPDMTHIKTVIPTNQQSVAPDVGMSPAMRMSVIYSANAGSFQRTSIAAHKQMMMGNNLQSAATMSGVLNLHTRMKLGKVQSQFSVAPKVLSAP